MTGARITRARPGAAAVRTPGPGGRAAPPVSIGMPVHNEAPWVDAAIASLRAQTHADFELTIADNASTDATAEICHEHAGDDARIRVVRRSTDVGPRANWNALAGAARGTYFCWAPGHDRWRPRFLAACIAALEAPPAGARLARTAASGDAPTVLAHPLAVGLDVDGALMPVHNARLDTRGLSPRRGFLTVLFGLANALAIHGLIRTDALRRTRGLGANVGPEYPLLAELALLGAIAHVPEPLFEYRRVRDETTAEFTHRTLRTWQHRHGRALVLSPELELAREHLRVARHAPISRPGRALLAAGVALAAADRVGVRGLRTTWVGAQRS